MSKDKKSLRDIVRAPNPEELGNVAPLEEELTNPAAHGEPPQGAIMVGQQSIVFEAPPEGFTQIDVDKFPSAYWVPEEGATLFGTLQRKIPKAVPFDKQWQYTLRLLRPTPNLRIADGELIDGLVGDLVGCDERLQIADALEGLSQDPPGTWDLWIQARSKVQLKNGNTLWKFAFFSRANEANARLRAEEKARALAEQRQGVPGAPALAS